MMEVRVVLISIVCWMKLFDGNCRDNKNGWIKNNSH